MKVRDLFVKIILKCDLSCVIAPNVINLFQNHIIMLVEELGLVIKNRRNELKITQPHLAELANISINTLYKIERGQSNPTLEVMIKIAEVLGMELKLEINKK